RDGCRGRSHQGHRLAGRRPRQCADRSQSGSRKYPCKGTLLRRAGGSGGTGAWGQSIGDPDEPGRQRSRPARFRRAGAALRILASRRPRVWRSRNGRQGGGVTHLGPVILTLTAGSSSLKFAAFALVKGAEPSQLASGQIEGIGATAQGSVKTA